MSHLRYGFFDFVMTKDGNWKQFIRSARNINKNGTIVRAYVRAKRSTNYIICVTLSMWSHYTSHSILLHDACSAESVHIYICVWLQHSAVCVCRLFCFRLFVHLLFKPVSSFEHTIRKHMLLCGKWIGMSAPFETMSSAHTHTEMLACGSEYVRWNGPHRS